METLNDKMVALVRQCHVVSERGLFDEKHFRYLVDVCNAASRVPSLEREIMELSGDLNATKCELDEARDEGEIVDNGEQLDLNE